jgi:SAM-dependent methyltransferase
MNFKALIKTLLLRESVNEELKKYFKTYISGEQTIYDIGCGNKPFASFFEENRNKYIGIDFEDCFYDEGKVDINADAIDLPIEDNIADAVVSSQVIEHVSDPYKALDEALRILKPGGYLFLSWPFLYPLHAEPYDFGRYTRYMMADALDSRNADILEFKEISGFWLVTGWMVDIYIQNLNRGILKKLHIAKIFGKVMKVPFGIFHLLEALIVNAFNKDLGRFRRAWPLAYVAVARKKIYE